MTYYLGGIKKSKVVYTCVARFKCTLTGLTLAKKRSWNISNNDEEHKKLTTEGGFYETK